MPRHLLDPKLDVVFKLLFADARNNRLLCSLLTAVLRPPLPITAVEVLNPEVTRQSVHEKGAVLDVRALLANRTRINVEMQLHGHKGLAQRKLYYWAKLYTEPLERGDAHVDLMPAIGIFILDFVELPWAGYHTTFRILDDKHGRLLSDDLAIHVLQLPRLRTTSGAVADTEAESAMVRWGRFLAADDDQEMEKLAMQDPDLREAKDALERLSADPEAQRLAREREQWAWNHAHALHWAQKEGEARGRAEGEARGILRVLLARGVALSGEQQQRVLNCRDGATLEALYRRALEANSADELFR